MNIYFLIILQILNELQYDNVIQFKDLIFDKSSEPIFYNDKNIFKLANGKYLIKIPVKEFEARLYNKEKNITAVLLNDYLNKIIIIEKDNILFIFLFHKKIKNYPNKNNDIEIELSERIVLQNQFDPAYEYEDEKYIEG